MTERKKINRESMIYTSQKFKIEHHEPRKNMMWTRVLRKGKQFLLQMWHRRVILVTNPVINHEWGKDLIVNTTKGTHPLFSTG
jgi:hypothetical protein